MIDGQHPFTEDEVTGASGRQEGGSHYKGLGVEPWDVMAAWDRDGFIGFLKFSALKRIARLGRKGGNPISLDLRKASHELQKAAEIAEKMEAGERADLQKLRQYGNQPQPENSVAVTPGLKLRSFSDLKEGAMFESAGEVYRKLGSSLAVRLTPGSAWAPDAELEVFENIPVTLIEEPSDD